MRKLVTTESIWIYARQVDYRSKQILIKEVIEKFVEDKIYI